MRFLPCKNRATADRHFPALPTAFAYTPNLKFSPKIALCAIFGEKQK